MIELCEVFKRPSDITTWANHVGYGVELSAEEKDVNEALDAWARELGKKGDVNHELSALVIKALPNDEEMFPTELIGRFFNEGAIGEFDDYEETYAPKNTIVAHEAIIEGNVDRSFIEHNVGKAQWHSLAAETDISMQDLRRGGYRTVATLVNYIREALELKRVRKTMDYIDNLVVSTAANYFTESATMPTTAVMDQFELYLHDVNDGAANPLAFSLSKYHQAISKLPQAERFYTDVQKNMYNATGFVNMYGGVETMSFSGQKKLADGALVVPDKRIFGVAGKIGSAITRGETRVLQEEDINNERIHIKVNGYTFGFCVNPEDVKKIAKVVLA